MRQDFAELVCRGIALGEQSFWQRSVRIPEASHPVTHPAGLNRIALVLKRASRCGFQNGYQNETIRFNPGVTGDAVRGVW